MTARPRQSFLAYESRGERLLPRRLFVRRLARHGLLATVVLGISLGAGAVGYRWTEGMGWLDAFLNAAMILSGMGPVDTLRTDGGKLFATIYSIFSGVIFLGVVGVVLAPLLHRMLHRFHLDEDDAGGDG